MQVSLPVLPAMISKVNEKTLSLSDRTSVSVIGTYLSVFGKVYRTLHFTDGG